ncbi:MAG TPA: DUF58 domain-containing protein [Sandaracinaceae bacterium]
MRRALRRVADYVPITPLGLFVGLGAGAALKYLAYPELDLVWLVAGFAALGLLAVALLAVIVAAIWVKVATWPRAHGERVRKTTETGASLPTGFSAPSFTLFPLVQIGWTWEQPEGVDVTLVKRRLRMHEEARLKQRGHVHGVRRRIVVQDAFGLARLAIRQTDPVELTVLPHVGKLGDAPLLVSLSGGDERPHPMGLDDGDRVELRRYVPGDPARFIHWKVFGRTRKLMVRVPERALSPARRTVAYQVAGPDDEASAAAARVAIESGSFGADFRFGADGSSHDTDRIDEAVEMIVRSASARDAGGRGLEAFVKRAERSGPASLVVFVPPRPGPWLAPVVATVKPRAPRSRVVVAVDGVDAEPRPPLWRRLLTLPASREGTPSSELEQVIAALASTRAEVIVLDRKTGRRLGKKHRAAMRKLEASRKKEAA